MTAGAHPITTLLVDDEPLARRRLRSLIACEPRLRLVDEAEDGIDAIEALRALRPELVFLDVQMPELTGFEVLQALPDDERPIVVFVTAYDEFAVRAFEIGAADYLLKPYEDERFRRAVDRVARATTSLDDRARHALATRRAADSYHEAGVYLTRVAVPGDGRVIVLDARDIDWIESADNYVRLHVGAQVHRLRTTMTDLMRKLDPADFLRVHRWYAVNLARIRAVWTSSHGDLVLGLTTGAMVRVSRNYAPRLRPPLRNDPAAGRVMPRGRTPGARLEK